MPINYQSDTSPIYAGRFPSDLSVLAASLNINDMTELPTTGLETLDGTGAYINETVLNDTAQDWVIDAVWSTDLQQGFFVGTAAGYISVEPLGTGSIELTYDAASNNWTGSRNPFSDAISHGFSGTAIVGNLVYRTNIYGLNIYVWDLNTGEAIGEIEAPDRLMGGGSTSAFGLVNGMVGMPTMGAEGSVLFTPYTDKLYRYDIATLTWTVIANNLVMTFDLFSHYNPYSDRVVFGGGGVGEAIFIVDKDENIITTGNLPANVYSAQPFIAAPNSNTSLLFALDGNIYPLDTLTGVWGSSQAIPVLTGTECADAIPISIPEHNCIMFEVYKGGGLSKVYLYRYS